MNKFLPNTSNNKAFTLIELMVVVVIIAILATIGVSIYLNVQGNARDGRRRAEISTIAKSVESSKDPATAVYKYGATDRDNDFPKGLPSDPTALNIYCINTTTATAPPGNPAATTTWTTTCPVAPAGYKDLVTSIGTATANNLGATTPDVKAWTLCASLERGTSPFCISSNTK